MDDALSERPPRLSPKDAATILAASFGLRGEVTVLPSERDFNAKVLDPTTGNAYVLKVQNPADSPAVVQFQSGAVEHVVSTDPALPVARLVPALDGSKVCAVELSDGRTSVARVFSFLSGRHVDVEELTPASLFAWGVTAARLGRALRAYFHPAANYPIQWDVRRTEELRPMLSCISDPETRTLVASVVDNFETRVAPVIGRLRHQVVHNDMGPANILVDSTGAISGIIDFGDMTYSALVCDVAVIVADVPAGRSDCLQMIRWLLAGYQSLTPLEPEESSVLADLIAARLATDIAVTAWRASLYPDNVTSTTGTLDYLRRLAVLGLDGFRTEVERLVEETRAGTSPRNGPETADLLRRRAAVFGPAVLAYDEPLHLVRGAGVWLEASDGRRYLDAYNNVPVVGHGNEELSKRLAGQLGQLNTNSRYLVEPPVQLAERIVASMKGRFDRVILLNSGSEANDLARTVATFVTGQSGALVTENAYHGITEYTAQLSPESWGSAVRPSTVVTVPAPAAGSPREPQANGGDDRASFRAALGQLHDRNLGLGATFVDPAFTSDGIIPRAVAYLRELQDVTRAAGGLLVADEVQAGFGRTGDHLWSYEAAGLAPDLVTLGKPMGNGYPLAALVGHSDMLDPFIRETGFFSTFGGNTAGAVAGITVLDVIQRDALVAHAAAVGEYLTAALKQAVRGFSWIREVRNWGLLVGVEIQTTEPQAPSVAGAKASLLVEAMRRHGVLIGLTGKASNVLKVRPPLVFEAAHADVLVEALAACVEELDGNGYRAR